MPAIVAYTQAELLALFERIFPVEYWQPILNQEGDGLEIFQAIAKVLSLNSSTIETFWRGSFLTLAPVGAKAQVEVELFRSSAALGQVIVLQGTVVTTSNGRRDFLTLSPITFGVGDIGPHTVTVEAIYPDDEFNVPGEATTLAGEVVPGSIDTIKTLNEDPPYGDPTIQVRQIVDATGGVFPWLEQLGLDRGLPRLAGELEQVYRWRIRQLPKVVTPNAVKELLQGIFLPFGFVAFSIEQHSMAYQTCYDGPTTSDANYDTNLFCYDDPRDPMPFRNRWLDEIEARGAFVVVVPLLPSVQELGMVYDDTAADANALLTVMGGRAMGAFDVPAGLLLASGVLEGCYDGSDPGKDAFYQGILDQLDAVKAAGVSVFVELEGEKERMANEPKEYV